MDRQAIVPTDQTDWLQMRAEDLTSTDIGALFGVSPYCTEFELWHRKKQGVIVELEPNERMVWGTRLEQAIAEGVAEDKGWQVRRMDEYGRLPDERLGASFDYAIEHDGNRPAIPPESGGLLEVKNVDALIYKDGWLVEGDEVEAPPHIELQIQHQLLVAGRAYTYLGALVGGNRVVLQRREPDTKLHALILRKAEAFWKSIADNNPPEPDLHRDAKFICSLEGYAEPGKVLNAMDDAEMLDLAKQYKEHGDTERQSKNAKEMVKAVLMKKIGDAEKVYGDGFTITAGMVGPAHVSYDRTGFRGFRVYVRKGATQ